MVTATITRYAHIIDIDPNFGDRAPDWEVVRDIEGDFVDVENGMSNDEVDELVWAYVLDQLEGIDVNEIEWEYMNADA